MKGKLYLRNVRNYINVPQDTLVINIARGNMPIACKKIELAPSNALLNWYLSNKHLDNWFDIYKVKYHKEIKSNPKAIESLRDIEYMLSNGQDVCLVCFCASHIKCHRGIIGGWFEKKGYEVLV